jgi:imidazolonepropionase
MKVIRNINQILTLESASKKDGRKLVPSDLDLIENGAIVYSDFEIIWVGKDDELPNEYKNLKFKDGSGLVLTPGLVDSHTHLVFGGDRAFEYTMRLNGADYQDIANAGGGILSTMEKTISSSNSDLFEKACERVERIYSYGVKAIEIKSGYALTFEKEKELTLIIDKLKKHFHGRIIIHNTFMAAHAVPKSFNSSKDYIHQVVIPLLEDKEINSIIDSVDIFHEDGYFTAEDVEALFKKCQSLSINTRIHADEFNDNKGAVLASHFNSLSADHLLATGIDGAKALSKSRTVATILPGTAFFLGKPLANARMFLDEGCAVAIASDYNPGSCHCDNLLMVASISAKSLGFNIAELWAAITLNAAKAINRPDIGSIEIGKTPLFSFFETENIDQITYSWGRNFFTSRL